MDQVERVDAGVGNERVKLPAQLEGIARRQELKALLAERDEARWQLAERTEALHRCRSDYHAKVLALGLTARAAEAERDRLRDALRTCADWPLEKSRFDLTRFARAALAEREEAT